MAITPDSGVRSNATIDLADLSPEDRQLISRRRTAEGFSGMAGMDVPINAPEHTEPHVVPLWVLFTVFGALIFLTGLTVAARFVEAGPFNIIIALGLAVLKGVLVGLFFMHLWWDNAFNQLVLVITLVALALFIGIAALDSDQYQPTIDPPGAYAGELNPPTP